MAPPWALLALCLLVAAASEAAQRPSGRPHSVDDDAEEWVTHSRRQRTLESETARVKKRLEEVRRFNGRRRNGAVHLTIANISSFATGVGAPLLPSPPWILCPPSYPMLPPRSPPQSAWTSCH